MKTLSKDADSSGDDQSASFTVFLDEDILPEASFTHQVNFIPMKAYLRACFGRLLEDLNHN